MLWGQETNLCRRRRSQNKAAYFCFLVWQYHVCRTNLFFTWQLCWAHRCCSSLTARFPVTEHKSLLSWAQQPSSITESRQDQKRHLLQIPNGTRLYKISCPLFSSWRDFSINFVLFCLQSSQTAIPQARDHRSLQLPSARQVSIKNWEHSFPGTA